MNRKPGFKIVHQIKYETNFGNYLALVAFLLIIIGGVFERNGAASGTNETGLGGWEMFTFGGLFLVAGLAASRRVVIDPSLNRITVTEGRFGMFGVKVYGLDGVQSIHVLNQSSGEWLPTKRYNVVLVLRATGMISVGVFLKRSQADARAREVEIMLSEVISQSNSLGRSLT